MPQKRPAEAERQDALRQLAGGVLRVLVLIAIGVLGYWWLEGWSLLDSLWMVAVTLTTVGYGDLTPQTTGGRLFTLWLLLAGLGVVTWSIGAGAQYVLGGALAQDLEARRRQRIMEHLRDHYVVVGLGRLGEEVATALHLAGRQVVVVDVKPERAESFPHCDLYVVGDGSSDDVLERAQLHRASGLAVATSSDAINVFVTLSARQLNPDIEILTRIDLPGNTSKAHHAGATAVISPYHIGGSRMAHALLHPQAAGFIERLEARDYADLAMDDVVIGGGLCGTLMSLRVRDRFGVLVVSVHKADGRILTTPGPDVELCAGDVAVVVGTPEGIARFAQSSHEAR